MARMPYHQHDFPYDRTLDALVTRREYLRLLTLTSAGLFLGTIGLAARVLAGRRTVFPKVAVAGAAGLAEGDALNFNYPTPDDPAIIVRLPGGRLVAYSQRCTHLSCAVYWDKAAGVLTCPCHEGFFDVQSGLVRSGPPTRPLPSITLVEQNGEIYASEVRS